MSQVEGGRLTTPAGRLRSEALLFAGGAGAAPRDRPLSACCPLGEGVHGSLRELACEKPAAVLRDSCVRLFASCAGMWALMDGGAAGQHRLSSSWSSDYCAPTSTTTGRLPLHKSPPRPGHGRRTRAAPAHADAKMESMTRISSMLETGTLPANKSVFARVRHAHSSAAHSTRPDPRSRPRCQRRPPDLDPPAARRPAEEAARLAP